MSTLDLEGLKPCPFCGGAAEIERYGSPRQSTIYRCTDCSCSLETGEEFGFGRRWNERAVLIAAAETEHRVCAGCGSSRSAAELKAGGHIACCPERQMLTAKEWSARAQAAEERAQRAEGDAHAYAATAKQQREWKEEAEAERDALKEECRRLRNEVEQTRFLITGGEDAPGHIASLPFSEIERVAHENLASWNYEIELAEALQARIRELEAGNDRALKEAIGRIEHLVAEAFGRLRVENRTTAPDGDMRHQIVNLHGEQGHLIVGLNSVARSLLQQPVEGDKPLLEAWERMEAGYCARGECSCPIGKCDADTLKAAVLRAASPTPPDLREQVAASPWKPPHDGKDWFLDEDHVKAAGNSTASLTSSDIRVAVRAYFDQAFNFGEDCAAPPAGRLEAGDLGWLEGVLVSAQRVANDCGRRAWSDEQEGTYADDIRARIDRILSALKERGA